MKMDAEKVSAVQESFAQSQGLWWMFKLRQVISVCSDLLLRRDSYKLMLIHPVVSNLNTVDNPARDYWGPCF